MDPNRKPKKRQENYRNSGFLSFFRLPIGGYLGLKSSTDWINFGLEAKMASKLGQLGPHFIKAPHMVFRLPIGVYLGLKSSTGWINFGLEAKMASKLGQLGPVKEPVWRPKRWLPYWASLGLGQRPRGGRKKPELSGD